MTRRDFEHAGWACVVSAIVTIAGIAIAFIGEPSEYRRVAATCSVASLLLFVWIYASFGRLLRDLYQYDGADTAINLLLGSSVVVTALGLLASRPNATRVAGLLGFLDVGAFIALGIAYVLFSVKLLRLEAPLFGFAKPLGYAGVAQGIAVASVIVMPFGVCASIVADVMRARMFFAAAAERRESGCLDCDAPMSPDAAYCHECGATIGDLGRPEAVGSWDDLRERFWQR